MSVAILASLGTPPHPRRHAKAPIFPQKDNCRGRPFKSKFLCMVFKIPGVLALLGILTLTACSRKKHEEVQLFYGECRVEVEASPHEAEILLDGIPVGHGSAGADMPCGERQVRVEKPGYVPYLEYFQVQKAAGVVKVKAKLEPVKLQPDFALSKELIELASTGKKIRDPWRDPLKPGETPEPEPDWTKGAPAGGGSSTGEATGAPAGGGASTFKGTGTYEDWL
jgi:hypothetical protein